MSRYFVWCPERSESSADARAFEACSPAHAVEQWAEREDSRSADYLIVGEKWVPTLCVKEEGDADVETLRFTVSGYTTAQYTAKGVA